jgi:hypothetical protein
MTPQVAKRLVPKLEFGNERPGPHGRFVQKINRWNSHINGGSAACKSKDAAAGKVALDV